MENMSTSPEVTESSSGRSSPLCPSNATHLVLPVLCGLMFCTGIPGNLLSLWVFAEKIPSKTPTHVYLINLSASNLLLCATLPMLAAYFAVGDAWRAHQPLCRVAVGGVTPVLHINIYVGVLILTWIALSRLAALTQQSHAGRPSTCTRILPPAFFRKLREVRFAQATCLAIWAFVLACVLPVVGIYSAIEAGGPGNGSGQPCYSVAVEVGGNVSQMTSVGAILLFCLCFLLVLASYVSVNRHISRARRNTAVPDHHRVYGRVFRNIVVIQLVLAVCLLPHHVFKAVFIGLAQRWGPRQPAGAGCHQLSRLVEVKNALLLLAAFRSAADPITYFLLDNTFRRHVLELLSLSSSKQSSQTTGSRGDQERTHSKATKL
ncbi:probable G-protein coupled receptor 82 [Anguilla anguilla]|uniref:probable G-protein coupled receptor 82 n=1 Tax=Anguilla anguilla TaxID=7936 RepID=UPI0015ACF5DC|nr:probable G-protein coupled receptor 82 [Anguilla anguilla]